MKYRNDFLALVQHANFLRASMNLAANRSQQLEETRLRLGFSGMPTDQENLTRLQVEAAKEIGGTKTNMLLDAPQEIAKYHFGPLQIAL